MSTDSTTRDDHPAIAQPPRIRPPDTAIVGETMTHLGIKRHDAVRRVQRVPKNYGAIYLVFRKAGYQHLDFDRLFARQEQHSSDGSSDPGRTLST